MRQFILFLALSGQIPCAFARQVPSKPIHVDLYGPATLAISGAASVKPSMRMAPAGGDTSVVWQESQEGFHLYSRDRGQTPPARLRAAPPRQNVRLNVPDGCRLTVQASDCPLAFTNVAGFVEGRTDSGDISMEGFRGTANLSAGNGNVRVKGGRIKGTLLARKGDILVEYAQGEPSLQAPHGKVTRRFSRDFFRGKTAERLQVGLPSGDIEVASAPEGASLQTARGDIRLGGAGKSVELRTDAGSITATAGAGINARARKGDVAVTLTGRGAPGLEPMDIEVETGNLTLTLPAGFSGQILLQHRQQSGADFSITSDVPLADALPAGPGAAGSGQATERLLRGGSAGPGLVRLRVTDGNVTIRRP